MIATFYYTIINILLNSKQQTDMHTKRYTDSLRQEGRKMK
jgi:hypothetical protein